MYDRVLILIDGSARGASAISLGLACSRPGAHVLLQHLVADGDEEALFQASRRLTRQMEALVGPNLRVEADVAIGDFAEDDIVDRAEGWPADMVVMGVLGRNGPSRVMLGGLDEMVAGRLHRPLLVDRWRHVGRIGTAPRTLNTILLPLDDHPTSLYLLPHVIRLARAHQATVLGVHVSTPHDLDALPNLAEAAAALQSAGVRYREIIVDGDDAVASILAVADRHHADMIALTLRLYPHTERGPQLSVPEWTLRLAKTPVFLMPLHPLAGTEDEEAAVSCYWDPPEPRSRW